MREFVGLWRGQRIRGTQETGLIRKREQESRNLPQASIKDVARIAGVSIATVSRCINDPSLVREKTRVLVEEAIIRTGYSPNKLAQSFRTGKTQVVMVVLPSVGDPFFTEVVKGIREIAGKQGYSILINETQFNTLTADEVGAMIVSRRADGIVLLATMSPFGNEVLSARNHRVLPIVIGCETISSELAVFPSVHIDNAAAAQEATCYLISAGHRRIAFIYGLKQSLLTKDREEGYRAAMHKMDLPVDPAWVREGMLTLEGGIQATEKLLQLDNRPTAIFCATDEMAMGCYHALNAAGLRIPEDISVVGFDDIRYARIMNPPLTTIYQPAEEIGKRVMLRLLQEIQHGQSEKSGQEIVPHKLVIRQSVARVD
jgi:LacI family repressor for deo operon, udp, cdd, tsx, nupC, and nupG